MKLFFSFLSFCYCCFISPISVAQQNIERHDHVFTQNQKENSLFSKNRLCKRYDISSLVNFNVPDDSILIKISNQLSQLAPEKETMTDDDYGAYKPFLWMAERYGGLIRDHVQFFLEHIVCSDFKIDNITWREGAWSVHQWLGNEADPNFFFYALYSGDTILKIYLYVIAIDVADTALKIAIDKEYAEKNEDKVGSQPLSHGKNDSNVISSRVGLLESNKIDIISTNEENNESVYKPLTIERFLKKNILFDVNSAAIKEESLLFITGLAKWLKENITVKLEIGGHTDNTGTPAQNKALSQARADEVKRRLVSLGVSETRLTTKGYGSSVPISPNTTPKGKANNRRVQFIKK